MKVLFQLLNALFVLGYFLLADTLGPNLVAAGERWLWWVILCALVGGSYLSARIIPPRPQMRGTKIRALSVIAYVLLLATLFLYDFSLRPLLETHGFGGAWIVSVLLLVIVLGVIVWLSPRQIPGSRRGPTP